MKKSSVIFLFCLLIQIAQAQHFDWPMWRYDAGRTASTPEQLADSLYLQWEVTYSERTPVWDDPLNQNLMPYDRIFEPIVSGNIMFIGFNDKDKVVALDLSTGKELWHFYADGPVRLPMAASAGKLYFTSDDGACYCLDAKSGAIIWKKMLAPASNKLLGNKRLISMWPSRGGIVLKDNILYSSASIWPMMGTFIYAIDATTGKTIWENEGTSDNYILQPHNYYAFAGIGPQGSFAISGDKLLVAGGRTVPGAFDLKTGKEVYFRLAEGKQTGGSFIACNDQVFFNHNRQKVTWMYKSLNGDLIKEYKGEYPVINGSEIYFSGKRITATSLQKDNKLDTLWKTDVHAQNDLIKAGNSLFAADSNTITSIKIADNKPQKVWSVRCDKTIERLLAAQGKLIAVTSDGSILVFGDAPVKNVLYSDRSASNLKKKINLSKPVGSDGYALVFGTKNLKCIDDLISNSGYSIIAFEKNEGRIKSLREHYDNLGITADRLAFLKFDNNLATLPKYLSSLTIINDKGYLGSSDNEGIEFAYESLRPFGGRLSIRVGGKKLQEEYLKNAGNLNLYGAQFGVNGPYAEITRSGALKGSADWTHNYGNISNTVKSDDDLAKAPLGILWFGGNSNMDVLPRHGHGPGEQVIDGRLIIEGINSLTARDVYTGRVLWKREFENLKSDTWQVYYNESYDEENPLVQKTNQVHLSGANSRGTNFVVTKEFVYVIEGSKCQLIDIATGLIAKTFTSGSDTTSNLGYIGVYDKYLILGNEYRDFPDISVAGDKPDDFTHENYDVTASSSLMLLDRFTGKKLWEIPSKFGFIHNSVIAGDDMLYCLDKMPVSLESKLQRRGEKVPEGRLLFIDIKTGQILHQETENIFGSWLGYSAIHKFLVQATTPSGDMLKGEDGKRMIVYNTVTKEKVWDKSFTYKNPPILHGDVIYTNGESFSILTGMPVLEKDLITSEDINWSFKREYGCGYVIASEHLLTFRSTAAGFINLDSGEGTSNLGGFKASCSANLVVANGVLNAPDYTRTCQCSYQNQTSLAFVNMPWMNYWTTTNYKWSGKPVKQLGLNLNAPGDRVSENKTLWLDFPSVGGISPEIPVKIDTVNFFTIRKNAISIKSENSPWISASAVGGLRSMEITLSKENQEPAVTYRVNLYFAELENKMPGERIFNVKIQDSKVLENFDIVSEAGRQDKEVIKSFTGIKAGNVMKIEMEPVKGNTILCGIELIQEPVKLTYSTNQ